MILRPMPFTEPILRLIPVGKWHGMVQACAMSFWGKPTFFFELFEVKSAKHLPTSLELANHLPIQFFANFQPRFSKPILDLIPTARWYESIQPIP